MVCRTGVQASPLVAGAMARTATAFVIQPLELFRVRVQGGPRGAAHTSYAQQLAHVFRQLHSEAQVCYEAVEDIQALLAFNWIVNQNV